MDHFYETALTLWEGLDTPLSLKAAMLLKAGEWQQLFELRADPLAYDNSELFWRDNQAAEFLRKLELDLGGNHREELEKAAVRQFYACEAQCAKTNLFNLLLEMLVFIQTIMVEVQLRLMVDKLVYPILVLK